MKKAAARRQTGKRPLSRHSVIPEHDGDHTERDGDRKFGGWHMAARHVPQRPCRTGDGIKKQQYQRLNRHNPRQINR